MASAAVFDEHPLNEYLKETEEEQEICPGGHRDFASDDDVQAHHYPSLSIDQLDSQPPWLAHIIQIIILVAHYLQNLFSPRHLSHSTRKAHRQFIERFKYDVISSSLLSSSLSASTPVRGRHGYGRYAFDGYSGRELSQSRSYPYSHSASGSEASILTSEIYVPGTLSRFDTTKLDYAPSPATSSLNLTPAEEKPSIVFGNSSYHFDYLRPEHDFNAPLLPFSISLLSVSVASLYHDLPFLGVMFCSAAYVVHKQYVDNARSIAIAAKRRETLMGKVSGDTEEFTDTEPSIVVDTDVNSDVELVPGIGKISGLATGVRSPTPEVATTDPSLKRGYITLTLDMLDTLKHAGSEWDAVINEALSFLESEERSTSTHRPTSSIATPISPSSSALRLALHSSLLTTHQQCGHVRQLLAALTDPGELALLLEMYAPASPGPGKLLSGSNTSLSGSGGLGLSLGSNLSGGPGPIIGSPPRSGINRHRSMGSLQQNQKRNNELGVAAMAKSKSLSRRTSQVSIGSQPNFNADGDLDEASMMQMDERATWNGSYVALARSGSASGSGSAGSISLSSPQATSASPSTSTAQIQRQREKRRSDVRLSSLFDSSSSVSASSPLSPRSMTTFRNGAASPLPSPGANGKSSPGHRALLLSPPSSSRSFALPLSSPSASPSPSHSPSAIASGSGSGRAGFGNGFSFGQFLPTPTTSTGQGSPLKSPGSIGGSTPTTPVRRLERDAIVVASGSGSGGVGLSDVKEDEEDVVPVTIDGTVGNENEKHASVEDEDADEVTALDLDPTISMKDSFGASALELRRRRRARGSEALGLSFSGQGATTSASTSASFSSLDTGSRRAKSVSRMSMSSIGYYNSGRSSSRHNIANADGMNSASHNSNEPSQSFSSFSFSNSQNRRLNNITNGLTHTPTLSSSSRFTTLHPSRRHPLSLASLQSALHGAISAKRYTCAHLLALRFEEYGFANNRSAGAASSALSRGKKQKQVNSEDSTQFTAAIASESKAARSTRRHSRRASRGTVRLSRTNSGSRERHRQRQRQSTSNRLYSNDEDEEQEQLALQRRREAEERERDRDEYWDDVRSVMSLLGSAFLDATGRLQEALDEAIRMKVREAESSLSERERENEEMDLEVEPEMDDGDGREVMDEEDGGKDKFGLESKRSRRNLRARRSDVGDLEQAFDPKARDADAQSLPASLSLKSLSRHSQTFSAGSSSGSGPVSFAPMPNALNRFAAHVDTIAQALDDARDQLRQCVEAVRAEAEAGIDVDPLASSDSRGGGFLHAVAAYDRLRRELGFSFRECERGRIPLEDLIVERERARRGSINDDGEDERLPSLVQDGSSGSSGGESDKHDVDVDVATPSTGSPILPTGVSAALNESELESPGNAFDRDDVSPYLLLTSTSRHLPPPGIEQVFEGESGQSSFNRERSKLTREERIKLVKARRESGLLPRSLTLRADALLNESGAEAQEAKRRGTYGWGPGGEVVQELKDVIWKVGERRRQMTSAPATSARTATAGNHPKSVLTPILGPSGSTSNPPVNFALNMDSLASPPSSLTTSQELPKTKTPLPTLSSTNENTHDSEDLSSMSYLQSYDEHTISTL